MSDEAKKVDGKLRTSKRRLKRSAGVKTRHVTIELTELEAQALARFLEFFLRFGDCVPASWSYFWKMRELVNSDEPSHEAVRNAPKLGGVRAALRRAWWKARDGVADLDGEA